MEREPESQASVKVELTRLTGNKGVKLHKSKNPWKPNVLKRRPVSAQTKDTDEQNVVIESIGRKTRGILNKLTPANFDKLVPQFMGLPLDNKDERISQVIGILFEKAINEPCYSATYARMVWTASKASQETFRKFRKQLLNLCQKEFQNSSADEADAKVKAVAVMKPVHYKQRRFSSNARNRNPETGRFEAAPPAHPTDKLEQATYEQSHEQQKLDLEEKKLRRRRSLGNVVLIGELYKLKMLTPKIMMECVQLLLLRAPNEEKLVCLCKLLTIIGETLDLELKSLENSAKLGDPVRFVPEQKWMKKILSQLKKLSENQTFSRRVRFKILDFVELYDNCWKPRNNDNVQTTIQQVKNDPIGLHQNKAPKTRKSKAREFQTGVKIVEPLGSGLPVVEPPSVTTDTTLSDHPGSSQVKSLPSKLPPTLKSSFQNLSIDDNGPSNNTSKDSGGYQEHSPTMFAAPRVGPSSIHSATFPPPFVTSSAVKNSRAVSPNDKAEFSADTSESVKNIFKEYFASRKFDDTLYWIKKRFPGENMNDFIYEISKRVAETCKEAEQKCAGDLVRLIIKNGELSKDTVIKLMAQGVVAELPDTLIDAPMATTYLARFLVEIFADENSLDWLVQIGDKLIQNEYNKGAAWRKLAANSLTLLKLRKGEENVLAAFKKTKIRYVLPVHEVAWLQ